MADSIPNGSMSMIDVNDLAKLHIAALEQETASGRYFALKKSWHWRDILATLSQPGRLTSTRAPPQTLILPAAIVWALSSKI